MIAKEITKKRGRPPLGDRPLTAAEKKARYRAALRGRKVGPRVFEVWVDGESRAKVEEIASILDISAARALRLCAEAGLGEMWLTALDVRDRNKRDPAERSARRTISELTRLLERAGVDTRNVDRTIAGLPVDAEAIALDVLVAEDDLKRSMEALGSEEELTKTLKEMFVDDGQKGGPKA